MKEYMMKFKDLCFKQIILSMNYQGLRLAKCAGWDLRDVILLLHKDTLLEMGDTIGEALDRYLHDVNQLFDTINNPVPPYSITIDEPLTGDDTFNETDVADINTHIWVEARKKNPYYYSSNGKVPLDVSEYKGFDKLINICDHILLSDYTYGGWWNPFTDFHTIGQEGKWEDMKTAYGNKMRGSYINLLTNNEMFGQLFSTARRLGMSDLWLFPGKDEDWEDRNCEEFYEKCKEFCKYAKYAGYGDKVPVHSVNTTQNVFQYCTKYPNCEQCTKDSDFSLERPDGFPEIVEKESWTSYDPFTR